MSAKKLSMVYILIPVEGDFGHNNFPCINLWMIKWVTINTTQTKTCIFFTGKKEYKKE